MLKWGRDDVAYHEENDCYCHDRMIWAFGVGIAFGMMSLQCFKWVRILLLRLKGQRVANGKSDEEAEAHLVLAKAIGLFAERFGVDNCLKVTGHKRTALDKVVNYISPSDMIEKLFPKEKASTGCSLSLGEPLGCSSIARKSEQMTTLFGKIQENSVDTCHPFFFNQLFGTLDPVALASEIIALSVNTSPYTYETAPVFTLMEKEVLDKLARLVFDGFQNDSRIGNTLNDESKYDGLMLPGGSLSNLTALHLARHYWRLNDQASNVTLERDEKKEEETVFHQSTILAFVSDEAHYSFKKSAAVTGIGIENVVLVPTLKSGQMDVEKLEMLLIRAENENSNTQFFVGATCGSTVRGSFDDVSAIVSVCREYENHRSNHYAKPYGAVERRKIWIHVDGAWGGPAIFSSRSDLQNLMKGVELADSFTLNPHKLLGAPQQTTAFVCRHKGILKAANSCGAKYLFDSRKHGAEFDTGDSSFMCGRRTDSIKLWAIWKYYGVKGIARKIETKVDALQTFSRAIQANKSFMLACTPWAFNVNFFYLPPRIQKTLEEHGVNMMQENPQISDDISKELSAISVELKLRLHQSGEMMIPYQPLNNQKADCFRLVLAGEKELLKEDMDRIFDLMEEHGRDL